MRANVPECAVQVPSTLQEALELLAREPGRWRPLAGGTDLMVPFAAGRSTDTRFLSLQRLDPLRAIEVDAEGITFGALVTYSDLRRHPYVQRHLPNLAQSAQATGAVAIQNRGTLGGNLVNASPAADTPPSLLAYAAQVELTGLGGSRWVAYDRFHTGYRQTQLAPGELLTRIRVPRPEAGFHFFRKVGTRAAQAVSKVCLAAYGRVEAGLLLEFRVGLGSVAPVPLRARAAEAALLGQPLRSLPLEAARAALMAEISPIDDIRSSARYRRRVAGNVLVQALTGFMAQGG
jgi:CO/xanthine dehydrogenase FAD-binding subunit